MIKTHLVTFGTELNPFTESLEQQLTEHGHQFVDNVQAQILICVGQDLQGFDEIGIQQIEQQLVERFLGAELFIQARAFPFARIRVGFNAQRQLIVASPVDESTLSRIIRLLEQFKRTIPERYEDKIGALPFPESMLAKTLPPKDTLTDTIPPAHSTLSGGNPTGIQLQQRETTKPLNTNATWEEKIQHWNLQVCDEAFSIPPELSHGSIQHVLQSAPVHKTVQDTFGRTMGLFGFPDLLRPTSRVLLVTMDGGCVALHRRGNNAVLSPIVEDLLFPTTGSFPAWVKAVLKDHTPLALEATKAYGQLQGESISCSQQRPQHKEEGKVFSTIASLLLHWSSR